jgi:hypothetical protein
VRPEGGTESAAGRTQPAGTAVYALLDVRAERLQLGGPELLATLQGPAPVTDHLADAGVAALLDLALDELLEMFPDDVAPATRKDDTPLNRKPGGLMEQSNASLQRGDQG